MSLKLVSFKSLGMVSYSPSIVTMAVSVALRYLASKSGVTLKTGLGSFKVIGNGTIDRSMIDRIRVPICLS